MYRTINDPVNLIQAQTSVDGTTGPLKKEANKSSEAKEANTRTPGNFVNSFESIVENQVGKKGISICATGLKSFFGLTQYFNYTLNYGSTEEQERILLGNNHKGIRIRNHTYKTLANIRSKDPNSITNHDVIEALASVTNDNDAALILSALLSLSTDNAKELALSKLNASTKTLGLYVYGISIGMDFKDIAHIMMSDVGRVINEVLNNDVFIDKDGYNSINDQLFKYFDNGPSKILSKFNIRTDSNGQTIESPLLAFTRIFKNRTDFTNENNKKLSLAKALVEFSRDNTTLSEKLNFLEDLRSQYTSSSTEAVEIYNQLIDFVEEYVQQSHIIGLNEDIYKDIKTLAGGAEEMKILGQLFGLNQGLKTSTDEFLKQINNIERAIYNKTNDLKDLINLTKFAFDETYREEKIKKYEEVKHSFNILDAISKVPHFLGYVQTLATAVKEAQNSFKFRSSKNLSLQVANKLGYKREDKIIKGVQNFVGDYLRKNWMLATETSFYIPKGNQAFTQTGEMFELKEDTPIRLGTDWGDATFRMWMENEVIPNLKNGIIKPGTKYEPVVNNKFIKDIGIDLLTKTVSHNTSIIYTLPINMLPRTDQERNIFNQYKSEFNKLAGNNDVGGLGYQYNITTYDNDGNAQTNLSKPIPLVDLFTYYAMIANNWKLGENSLVSILEDFQNTGIINNFHEYEAAIDQSDEVLDIEDIDFETDLLPYVAPFENPYTSYSNYIQYRNRDTKKYQLMKKLVMDNNEDFDTDQNIDETDSFQIKDYKYIDSDIDTNYFQKGNTESPTVNKRIVVSNNNQKLTYHISYDKETGKMLSLSGPDLNGNDLTLQDFPSLTYVLTKKINGAKHIDTTLLESIIKNKLNSCNA